MFYFSNFHLHVYILFICYFPFHYFVCVRVPFLLLLIDFRILFSKNGGAWGFKVFQNYGCPSLQNNICIKHVHMLLTFLYISVINKGSEGRHLVVFLEVPKIMQKVLEYVRGP